MSLTTITTKGEVWPIAFGSAAQAIRWADDFMIRSGDRNLSQLGGEVRARNRRTDPPSVDLDGELITGERLQDMAETISVTLSTIANPAGRLYRHIYGKSRRTQETAAQLVILTWDGPGHRKQRSREKMLYLALLVIEANRRAARGERLTLASMARNLCVSRDCFRRSWEPYVLQMQEHVHNWIERADRDLTMALRDKGIL
jgi:hypothetical protein